MSTSAQLVLQYMSHLAGEFSVRDSQKFFASVPLDPASPNFSTLLEALQHVDQTKLTVETAEMLCQKVDANARTTFARFALALLRYLKGDGNDKNSHAGFGGFGSGTVSSSLSATTSDSKTAFEDFQRLNQVYIEANRLYAMSTDKTFVHAFLNPLIVALARRLYKVGTNAAALSTEPTRSSASSRAVLDEVRKTIYGSFNTACSPMTDIEWSQNARAEHSVGDIIWPLANILWRTYSERRLHSQAVEIEKHIVRLVPSEEIRMQARAPILKQTDICESFYWRGKVQVVLLNMREAKQWLDKAWQTCPETSHEQRRSILIRLTPINLLLGRLLSLNLLEQYNLQHFLPLIHAFQTGNIPAWRAELERHREWYRARSIWLVLYERGEILVWRNLFRLAWKDYITLNPTAAAKSQCPTWVMLQATQQCFKGSGELEDGDVTMEDVICALSSLIDHGIMLGYVSYSNQTLVMKKADDGFGGFPKLWMVEPRAFRTNG